MRNASLPEDPVLRSVDRSFLVAIPFVMMGIALVRPLAVTIPWFGVGALMMATIVACGRFDSPRLRRLRGAVYTVMLLGGAIGGLITVGPYAGTGTVLGVSILFAGAFLPRGWVIAATAIALGVIATRTLMVDAHAASKVVDLPLWIATCSTTATAVWVAIRMLTELVASLEQAYAGAMAAYREEAVGRDQLDGSKHELEELARIEMVGRLAGGVAHDVNNALATIVATADVIGDVVRTPEQRQQLDELDAAAQQAAELVRALLRAGRRAPNGAGAPRVEPGGAVAAISPPARAHAEVTAPPAAPPAAPSRLQPAVAAPAAAPPTAPSRLQPAVAAPAAAPPTAPSRLQPAVAAPGIRDVLRARVRRGVDVAVLVAATFGSLVAAADLARGTSHEPVVGVLAMVALAVCAGLGVLGRARWTPIAFISLILVLNVAYLATEGVWFGLGTIAIMTTALAFLFISPRGAWIVGGVFAITPLALGVVFHLGVLPDRPAMILADANDWRRAAFGSLGGLAGVGIVASYAVGMLVGERHKLEVGKAALQAQRCERERVDAELVRAHRIDAIAQLAGNVAGEIAAAIATIEARATALSRELADADVAECFEDLTGAASAAAATVRSLTVFAPGAQLAARGDVAVATAALGKLVRRTLPSRIALEVAAAGEAQVNIGTTDLTRALANLVLNARDAIAGPGRITVTTEVAGDRVVIAVADTGCGMPPETQARLFQPFFTTKAVGRGTGLGLATTKLLVDHAGGTIAVASAPDRGTTVSIQLPLV